MNLEKFENSQFKGQLQETVRAAEAIRGHKDNPVDISFPEIVKQKFNVTIQEFMADLGINPSIDSIQNIVTLPDLDARWIIPEVFREALVLGYRAAPIYPNIIAAEEQMKGLSQVMPSINMSDATPKKVNEGETIPLGDISYGSKQFRIFKIGRGIKISYEVAQYSSLNVVSIFLRDFGVKLGHGVDVLAIDCLINGEQADGSESAPVIGTTSGNSLVYKDLLRPWVRLGRIGRTPTTLLGGETIGIDTLDLDEFKKPVFGKPEQNLVFKSPIPSSTNFYVHGNIPDDQEIILDPSAGIIKFNGWPLMVESEKIVSNQTQVSYVTLQTGFAKLFRDSAIIVDRKKSFATYGFPAWMDVDALQNVVID